MKNIFILICLFISTGIYAVNVDLICNRNEYKNKITITANNLEVFYSIGSSKLSKLSGSESNIEIPPLSRFRLIFKAQDLLNSKVLVKYGNASELPITMTNDFSPKMLLGGHELQYNFNCEQRGYHFEIDEQFEIKSISTQISCPLDESQKALDQYQSISIQQPATHQNSEAHDHILNISGEQK